MRVLLIISLILGIVLQLYYYAVLPDNVAINFGSEGQPNSWTSKEWNMGITLSIYLLNSFLFLSVPSMMRKLPFKFISFPKKEYWLADERKKESLPLITSWLDFFGFITNVFILLIAHLVYEANLSESVRLNDSLFFTGIIIYCLVMLIWIVLLFKKFNKIS